MPLRPEFTLDVANKRGTGRLAVRPLHERGRRGMPGEGRREVRGSCIEGEPGTIPARGARIGA